MIIRNCVICNEAFSTYPCEIKKGWGIFCGKNCANKSKIGQRSNFLGKKHSEETKIKMRRSRIYLKCKNCSKEFWNIKANVYIGKGKFCSRQCRYAYPKKFKTFCKGYSYIYMPEHPFSNRDGRVREHRAIIEKFIKRYLNEKEEVHHCNNKRLDNRICNLIAFISKSAHRRFHGNPKNVKPEEIIFDGRLH